MPAELDAAWPFFARRGWVEEEDCTDLVQALGKFKAPGWLAKSVETAGVRLRLSNPALRGSVAAFEAVIFPAWASYFKQGSASAESDERILGAQGTDGEIVGTLLLDAAIPCGWSMDQGFRIGSVNALAVAPERRQAGIGLASAARAMEVLQERGCAKCYIQWPGLAAWYGKLGASVWARYRMAKKLLCIGLAAHRLTGVCGLSSRCHIAA